MEAEKGTFQHPQFAENEELASAICGARIPQNAENGLVVALLLF